MRPQIFINLPVKDLAKAIEFYTKIGFTNKPTFTDETGACMQFSDEIFVMILTRDRFKDFIKKDLGDTTKTTSVINSISRESIAQMNEMADNALKAGGTEPTEPKVYDFMQQRSFEDLDGNFWEVFYMDMSKFPQQ